MRLFIFKSESRAEMRAFAPDAAGSKLPPSLAPWRAIGLVAAHRNAPHGLSREAIENGIEKAGYQLWRVRPAQRVKENAESVG